MTIFHYLATTISFLGDRIANIFGEQYNLPYSSKFFVFTLESNLNLNLLELQCNLIKVAEDYFNQLREVFISV